MKSMRCSTWLNHASRNSAQLSFTSLGNALNILTFPSQTSPIGRDNTISKSRSYHTPMSAIGPQSMTESTKDSEIRQLVSSKFTTLNMVTMELIKRYRPFWLIFTIWTLAASFVTFIGKFSEMLPKFFWWTGFRHLCCTRLYFATLFNTQRNSTGRNFVKIIVAYTMLYCAALDLTMLFQSTPDFAFLNCALLRKNNKCYLCLTELGSTVPNYSRRYGTSLSHARLCNLKTNYFKSTHANLASTSNPYQLTRINANGFHLRSVNNRLIPFNSKTQLPTRSHSYPITDVSPLSCWIDRGTNVKINGQFIIFTQGLRKSTIKTRDKAVSQNLIIHNGDSRSQSALNRASAAFRKFSAFFQGSKNISPWYVNLTIFSKEYRTLPFLRIITGYASSFPFFEGDGIASKSMIQKWPGSFNRYIGRQNVTHLTPFLFRYSSIALRICSDKLSPFSFFRDSHCFTVIYRLIRFIHQLYIQGVYMSKWSLI